MRQKILILICEGGGGHKSAGDALIEILSPHYDIEVANAIDKIIEPLDWFKHLSIGKLTGEAVYNWFLQNEMGTFLRAYVTRGRSHLGVRKEKIARLFENHLKTLKGKPDLIISTIPFINHGLLLTAKKHNIPFLLLPTDLDVTVFLNGFDKISRDDLQLFKLALAYNRQEIIFQVFKNSALEPQDLLFSGFPVRPACQISYSHAEIEDLKKQSGLESNRPTITLVMGAAGGNAIVEHALEISRLAPIDGKRVQVNVCTGYNKRSKKRLIRKLLKEGGKILQEDSNFVKIESKDGVLLMVRGFAKEMITLLASSDLVISKTGSCTINEAIYLGKKLLVDHSPHSTARALFWEEFNVWFVKRHRLGAPFTKTQELRSLIPFMLKEKGSDSPSFPLPDFRTNIKKVVSDLVSKE